MKVILKNSSLVFASQKPLEYLVNEAVSISNSELYRPQVNGENLELRTENTYAMRIKWLKEGALTSNDNLNLVSLSQGIEMTFEPSKHNGVVRNFTPSHNFFAIFQSSSNSIEDYEVQIWLV